MPGAMRKLGLYLGLVEDDEDARDRRYADDAYDDDDLDEPAPVVVAPLVAAAGRRPHGDAAPPARGHRAPARRRRPRHRAAAHRAGAGPAGRHLPHHDAAPAHLQRGAHDR